MPTYVYRCDRCGAEIERVQSMSEPSLRRCPECKAMKLRRVFQSVGIVLKGPGFHKTDYAPKRSSEGGGKKDEKKTESKPAESKASESKASESKASEGGTSKSK